MINKFITTLITLGISSSVFAADVRTGVNYKSYRVSAADVAGVTITVSGEVRMDDCNAYGLSIDGPRKVEGRETYLADVFVFSTEMYCGPETHSEVLSSSIEMFNETGESNMSFELLVPARYSVVVEDIPAVANVLPLVEAAENLVDAALQAKSCQVKSECAALNAGARACGGPSTYVAYSTRASAELLDNLKISANAYTEAERQFNADNGVISICSVLNPPAAFECIQNTCVAMERSWQNGEFVMTRYSNDISDTLE